MQGRANYYAAQKAPRSKSRPTVGSVKARRGSSGGQASQRSLINGPLTSRSAPNRSAESHLLFDKLLIMCYFGNIGNRLALALDSGFGAPKHADLRDWLFQILQRLSPMRVRDCHCRIWRCLMST